ncbi:RNA-directed DNA polymerase [Legionella spiritensis]|uniref:Reverse transcriptase (RNA-dependent DNA polymerase) n=1 Tax=Legionella spiritensis TaxID=452 RepID=A0A0W0Z8U3_LEGSP|nr:RNA-directed DNA polymerase [Legionella spiritensis]KTD65347.1 hypothetical protein Lspi_0664 [Legionella spiritensis]SNV47371.1 Uncharacterised protein [Legionella spiritensis]
MDYSAEFKGWDNLLLEDLLVAYRKAKADCYYEKILPTSIKFAKYEKDLLKNLNSLLNKLKKNPGFKNDSSFRGEYRLIPKKLNIEPKEGIPKPHVHFSDPYKSFKNLIQNKDMTPEFRVIGDFPVITHIISALWVNMIGHKLDACLTNNCYGFRLKRLGDNTSLSKKNKRAFHISAIGSFEPYFFPYQQWRKDGIKAMKSELNNNRKIIAASLDLKSYYHFIDPNYIKSNAIYDSLALDEQPTDHEKNFTDELAEFLDTWSNSSNIFINEITQNEQEIHKGLAIGLTATQIISNLLLHKWDDLILKNITPIYYGRYVDDMFLVIPDPETISNADEFMGFLQKRIGKNYLDKKDNNSWQIQLGDDFQGKSYLRLQQNKQKLFLLQGQRGLDLLDSIEKEIKELSSEFRLMPSPENLEKSTAAQVLSATLNTSESADTLRRADGVTIRRLSWALQMRHVETLALDLPISEWEHQRNEFYQFAHNHILSSENLFDHFSYLPRLLGFAIGLNEWVQATYIIKDIFSSLNAIAEECTTNTKVTINGNESIIDNGLWDRVKETLGWFLIETITQYLDPMLLFSDELPIQNEKHAKYLIKNLLEQQPKITNDDVNDIFLQAKQIAISDLSKTPYKNILESRAASQLINFRSPSEKRNDREILNEFSKTKLIDIKDLRLFIKLSKKMRLHWVKKKKRKGESFLPYIFPTRPYTPAEITELIPQCIGINSNSLNYDPYLWGKLVKLLRGVWVNPDLINNDNLPTFETKRSQKKLNRIEVGYKKNDEVILVLTNIKTTNTDWEGMACNKPQLNIKRYKCIAEMVNQTIKLNPRPDYVLFPELSIPPEWIGSIENRLTSSGISLIAGTEYKHYSDDEILSETCLVLTDDRLGFQSHVKIWQPKLKPSPQEEKELYQRFGKTWYYDGISDKSDCRKRRSPTKHIYKHNDFYFAVLACSELQNSKTRIKFQGEVDALIVLSWNKDIETFSSLIEATALDIHGYTILVNNRLYGDSRVRSPAKEGFMRDLARLRGGDNDYCIAVTIDTAKLRAFQSRATRWPDINDSFKPVPEGFKLNPSRKKLPPK